MKNRQHLPNFVLVLLLGAMVVISYQMACNNAAEWRVMGPEFQDTLVADTDGLGPSQVNEFVQDARAGSADLARWPVTGGMISLAVLDYRLRELSWYRAWKLSERIVAQAPESHAAQQAAEVHRKLTRSIVFGFATLMCLAGSLAVARPKASA